MSSGLTKKAKDHIPFCEDQGMPYLCGAAKAGVSVQAASYTFVAGGAITFDGLGLSDMADDEYLVFAINHTSEARPAKVDPATRTKQGFTVSGSPIADDVLHLMVIGSIKGQLS